jgi:hypothetical protein
MKGIPLPAVRDFEWNDPRTESPYLPDRACNEIDESPPKADEPLAHLLEIPQMGKNPLLRAVCVSVPKMEELSDHRSVPYASNIRQILFAISAKFP